LAPLIPETREFYQSRMPGRGPANLEELHEVRARTAMAVRCEPEPEPELIVIGHGSRSVPIRVHRPVGTRRVRGVILEMHGGGFYMGSAAGSDARNRHLATALEVAVVSVDYRLAPEAPWPAAPDDCETAALWLSQHVESKFGTTKLMALGFSAGATLALTTLLRLRDRDTNAFSGAVLQFGTYDLSAQTPAGRQIADEYFLDAYAADATPTQTSRRSTRP
jgi:acetyl esterase